MKFALIVSHEIGLQESLRVILQDDFVVLTANSGKEALIALTRRSVDVVFVDTNLPDYRGGLGLVERIRELNSDLPVVIIASSPSSGLIQRAQILGSQEILLKPFEKEHVRFVAKKALERKELVKQLRYLKELVTRSGRRESYFLLHDRLRYRVPERTQERDLSYQQFALREFFKSLAHISDLNRLLDYMIRGVAEVFGVNKASIMLWDEASGRYRVRASVGLDEEHLRQITFIPAEGCPAWFLKFNQILKVDDPRIALYTMDGIRIQEEMEAIQAIIAAPLLTRGRLIGILNLGNKVTGRPFFEEDLHLLSMISNYTAIAIENSLLYQEISLQKRYNESILENIVSGVITIDKNGRVTTYNRSAERIMTIPSGEALGRHIQRLGSVFADILLKTLEGKESFYRYEVLNPLTKAPMGISTSQLKDHNGEVVGAIMVFSDLRDIKELEKKNQAVERLRFWSNLANRMAQEIRNPLVAIKTFAQLLPEKFHDEEFRNDFYQIVTSEIERLNHITHKLMEFAQPREAQLEEEDINTIIDQAILANEDRIHKKKAKIIKQLSKEPLIANVDRKHLQEALAILIENGLDAIPMGGRLRIKTTLYTMPQSSDPKNGPAKFIGIEVEDSGCGIPKEHLKDIFSPFFTTKIKGMGFGLSIAQRIVQDHQGKIEVFTEEGKGSKFRILIPKSLKGVA